MKTLPMEWNEVSRIEDLVEGRTLLMNKPIFWTSFDLVNKVRSQVAFRYRLKTGERRKIKVGHAGTLDPYAEGLMIICTGKKTKTLHSYQGEDKEYLTTLELGKTTPSYDLETIYDKEFPERDIKINEIRETLSRYQGEIDQVPPIYSAKSVKGKRAYHAARKGQDIKLEPQKVYIDNLEVVEYDYPLLTLRISCSKGTYVRSLARDIGEDLRIGAHIVGLRRIRSGRFYLSDAISVEEFEKKIQNL